MEIAIRKFFKRLAVWAGEMVKEVRTVVENLDLDHTSFRANHASNYAPLAGTFNKDKQKLLKQIDSYFTG